MLEGTYCKALDVLQIELYINIFYNNIICFSIYCTTCNIRMKSQIVCCLWSLKLDHSIVKSLGSSKRVCRRTGSQSHRMSGFPTRWNQLHYVFILSDTIVDCFFFFQQKTKLIQMSHPQVPVLKALPWIPARPCSFYYFCSLEVVHTALNKKC